METIELYKLEAFRGQTSPDPKIVSEYLMSLDIDKHRRYPESWSILYQDVLIPEPFHELINTLLEEIVIQVSETFDTTITVLDPVWCIRHDLNNQTYPHTHEHGSHDWACVYWAQTPPGSGMLEYYPFGLPGPTYNIKPRAGEFLVFPGSLLHGVRHHTNPNQKRISMSCNLRASGV